MRNRTRAPWSRLFRRKPRIVLGDELAQCLRNGIDYEAEGGEWKTYPAANDNGDTLAAFRETGADSVRGQMHMTTPLLSSRHPSSLVTATLPPGCNADPARRFFFPCNQARLP